MSAAPTPPLGAPQEWKPGQLRERLVGEPSDVAVMAGFLRFGIHLRRYGLPATTGRMIDLFRAMPWLDLHSPDEFYFATRCLLTERVEDLAVFDRAFMAFFNKPKPPESEAQKSPHAMPRVLRNPTDDANTQLPSLEESNDPEDNRIGQPVRSDREQKDDVQAGKGEGAGLLSWSGEENLRNKDFAALTPEELRAAQRLLHQMQWKVAQRRSRRLVRASHGRHVDWRRSYRRNIGYGGVLLELERQRTKIVKRPLVVIADVSGSMDRYTKPVLQLVHTMRAGHGRVEAFVFGTRLTRVTKHLTTRNPDAALRKMSDEVTDWAGGTRIGDSLRKFNHAWSRRILGRGSVVIILSDGWDRGDPQKMSYAMANLQRRCHRLVWLNPALGGPTTRPVPLGMKAAMPYIDNLMPARNLNDLAAVGALLAGITSARPARKGLRVTERAIP